MKLITRLCSFRTRSRNKSRRQGPDRRPDGYALMVMLIAVTVMTIALLTVLPSAYQEARREREEELLFRGNQYAQAIYLFQKHFNRYPNSVKELLHTDNLSFLRRPWPDPMTPGGKWRFIHAGGAGAVLDSWTLGPAAGASPLGQNSQNGQNGQNGMNGPNNPNGSNSGFGQSGSSGFGSSSSFGSSGFGGSNSTNSSSSSFSLGGGNGGGAASSSSSSSQSDFGWPSSGAGSSQSGDTGQQGGSWDTTAISGLPSAGTDLSGTPGSPTPGSTTPGASDSINSLSPAALHSEEPGRPLDANGKPKMSPDCIGGNQNGGSSSSSANSSTSSPSNSSSSSSSSSSFSSFGSQGPPGTSGFSTSSPSSSSFGSVGSSGGPLGAAVVGVASCNDQISLRIYNKHHRYSEWEFVGVGYNPLGSGASTTPVQSPGQTGLGQQGQGSSSSSGFGSSGNSGQTGQPGSPGSAGSQPGNGAPAPTPAPTPPDNPPNQPPGP